MRFLCRKRGVSATAAIWTPLMTGATRSPRGNMDGADLDYAKKHLAASRDAFAKAAEDADFMASLGKIAAAMTAALKSGGKILLCGNGGSAADAQHIAGGLSPASGLHRARAPPGGPTT